MGQVAGKNRKSAVAPVLNGITQWLKDNLGIIITLVVLCLILSLNPITKNTFLTLRIYSMF